MGVEGREKIRALRSQYLAKENYRCHQHLRSHLQLPVSRRAPPRLAATRRRSTPSWHATRAKAGRRRGTGRAQGQRLCAVAGRGGVAGWFGRSTRRAKSRRRRLGRAAGWQCRT
eukprot:scaffold141633_cov31-Tisochrysis_lutea.AAC.5